MTVVGHRPGATVGMCQAHLEKSSDLMGKLTIFRVRFWIENVPHGLLHQSDVTDFVAMRVFSSEKS